MRSLALSAAARNRPPYCIRGVAPTIAIERGLSILWIDVICGSAQNSMTPPEKNLVRRVGKPTLYEWACHPLILPHHWLKQSACGQSLRADAGRGDLLKTIIDRVALRPNGLRMILSLVPLTPAVGKDGTR